MKDCRGCGRRNTVYRVMALRRLRNRSSPQGVHYAVAPQAQMLAVENNDDSPSLPSDPAHGDSFPVFKSRRCLALVGPASSSRPCLTLAAVPLRIPPDPEGVPGGGACALSRAIRSSSSAVTSWASPRGARASGPCSVSSISS